MCLIVTIIMIVLSVQNLILGHWLVGSVQFIIALGFLVLLLRNIQKVRCDRDSGCVNGCSLTNWIGNILKKKEN